jgi:hypothetical protein
MNPTKGVSHFFALFGRNDTRSGNIEELLFFVFFFVAWNVVLSVKLIHQ